MNCGRASLEDESHKKTSNLNIALQTVGCKLNQAETESLASRFLQAGYKLVKPDSPAEIFILNTCTVTHVADRKCRHILRSYHRRYPQAFIVVTGCYAERSPEEISQIEGVGLVVGNKEKFRLAEMMSSKLFESRCAYGIQHQSPFFSRTRFLVKVQEGCNQHCTYCIVPKVRGQGWDVPQDEVVAQVKAKVEEGYQEVVLTGTQIGDYRDGGLIGLIQRILNETEVKRLRLSSLQSQHLSPDLLRLWKNRRLCRHLHLPLQSGSDAVLRRMGRRYSTAEYEQRIKLTRKFIPDLAITTDVMVGFPGESEEEFWQSYKFCERLGFARLHVFPFSERPGTPAARLPGKISEQVKSLRKEQMLKLAKQSSEKFCRSFLGRKLEVLWEGKKNGLWFGHTDNYLKVSAQSDCNLRNLLLPARLVHQLNGELAGEIEI